MNFRHVFYAISFPMHRIQGRGWRAYGAFALTDEAYALTATPEAVHWSRVRLIGIQAFFHLAWVLCVAAGAGLGSLIPPQVVGLDFAVTALFVLAAYTLRDTDPCVLASFGPAVLALALTIGLHLWRGSMTLSIFAGTAAYVLVTSVIAA